MKIMWRLVAMGWVGYLIGSAVMFKDIPPSPPTPTTWWNVITLLIGLLGTMYFGYEAGREQERER
jgi:peptidoglycan/LPS O-acetylase OafA/YrhL